MIRLAAAALVLATAAWAQEDEVGDKLARLLQEVGCEQNQQALKSAFVADGGTPSQFQAEALALIARGRMERGEDGELMRLVGIGECE